MDKHKFLSFKRPKFQRRSYASVNIKGFLRIILVLSSVRFCHVHSFGNQEDMEMKTCIDNFVIENDKIIRTEESKRLGGKYLNGQDLISKEECLKFCCETIGCNVFVFEEKHSGTCYLFDCGPQENFKCKFTKHHNYSSGFLIINRPSIELEDEIKYTQHEHELAKLRDGFIGSGAEMNKLSAKSNFVNTQASLSSPLSSVMDSQQFVPAEIKETNSVQKSQCSRNQFECRKSGECIAIYNTCDGIPQCSDHSDEDAELGCPTSAPYSKLDDDQQNPPEIADSKNFNNLENTVWYNRSNMNFSRHHKNVEDIGAVEGDYSVANNPLPEQQQFSDQQQISSGGKNYLQNWLQSRNNQPVYNIPKKGATTSENFLPENNKNYNNNNLNVRGGNIMNAGQQHVIAPAYGREGEYVESNPWAMRDTNTKIFKQNDYGPLHNFNHKTNPMSNHPMNFADSSNDYQNNQQYNNYNGVMVPVTSSNYYHYAGSGDNSWFAHKTGSALYEPELDSSIHYSNAKNTNGEQTSEFSNAEYYYNGLHKLELKEQPVQELSNNGKIKHEVRLKNSSENVQSTSVPHEEKRTEQIKQRETTPPTSPSTRPITATVPINNTTISRSSSTKAPLTSTQLNEKSVTSASTMTNFSVSSTSAVNYKSSKVLSSEEIHSHKKLEKPLMVDNPKVINRKLFEDDEVYKTFTTQPTGAIIALSTGLFLTCVMLFVVGCRLRVVRKRIRRGRSFSRDADFLVNGMYL